MLLFSFLLPLSTFREKNSRRYNNVCKMLGKMPKLWSEGSTVHTVPDVSHKMCATYVHFNGDGRNFNCNEVKYH